MSRPVVTANLLEEMRRSGREIHLARNALITPAARDWLKAHAVNIVWQEAGETKAGLAAVLDPADPQTRSVRAMLERMGLGADVIEPAASGVGPLSSAVRRLCGRIARRQVTRGLIVAADACVPLVVANKHHAVRAVLGSGILAVQDACRELAANVLVVESRGLALFQVRQMIERLMQGPTAPPAEMSAMLESIERSGGREDW